LRVLKNNLPEVLIRISRFKRVIALAAGALLLASAFARADEKTGLEHFFYRPFDYGSESQFNPVSSFINYGLDPLQIPESFELDHFGRRSEEVWRNLTDPVSAIEREGGWRHFVNRQIFPVDFSNIDDSVEMIPNYALHVIGGGMLYRKNAEWFHYHGYPYPRVLAATLSMASEFVHEVLEKKSTADDDAVADFYIMRPLGIALFTWDPVARFASEKLRLAGWTYQPMFSPRHAEFMNVGQSWIVRPPLFRTEKHKPFLFYGMTTLLGGSHQVSKTDSFSWGVGPAVRKADPKDFKYRLSGGLFYDRNNSLLASLMVNGTENLLVRLNIYPGALVRNRWFPGIFLGVGDESEVSVGLTWRFFPLGISDRID
jgi:hypothetical protein